MKLLYSLIAVLILFAAQVSAQSLNMRLNSYFYTWERADSIGGASTNHLRGYQNLSFDINGGKWSFNTWMQTGEDLTNQIGRGFEYSLYNAYLKGSDLFGVMDMKLGRQYVYAGVGKGPIDGLLLKFKAGSKKEYQFTAYGGFNTPANYDFTDYGSLNNDFLAGANLGYYGMQGLVANLSFMERYRKPQSYTAPRLDTAFNTAEYSFATDSKQYTLGGLDFNYAYKHIFGTYGKLYFDFNRELIYKGEINASYATGPVKFSAGYQYREPQISYNSIFWTFEHEAYQEIEGSIDYSLNNGMIIYGKLADVIFTDDNSLRYQIGFGGPNYGISYIGYSGSAGNSNGFNAYGAYQLVRDILSGNASVGYASYYLGSIESEKQDNLTGTLGLTYRPSRQVSIDAQGQILTNRDYSYDTRLLLGINYWLFSNLNK
jgi:hypothetical protein